MKAATSAPRLLTLVMMTGLSVMSLNMFVPSLVHIASSLSTSYGLVTISIAGYLGITAALQLLVGPLSDRFGRRPVTLIGLSIFIVASIGCALARDIGTFLSWRMLQGAVAVGTVMSPAIIRDMVPAREAASRMGYLAMAVAVAPLLGPVLGGTLDELIGWRANFVFLAGFGFVVLSLCWFDLGETNIHRSETFMAQFKTYPRLLRSGNFWGYALCSAFSVGGFYVFISGAPLVAESVLNLSPMTLGIYIGSISAGYMAGSFLSGRFATQAGLIKMIMTGRLVTCAGLSAGLIAVQMGMVNVFTIFGATMFIGIGNGLTIPSSNTGAMSVNPELAGSASGVSGALTVGTGGVLTILTGVFISGANSAAQLLALMLFTASVALLAALVVRHTERASP